MKSASRPSVAHQTLSLSAFMEQVIEAVLPLLDESGTDLREGKTRTDAVIALQPLFGHFTVFDAVMVHFMPDPAGNTDCEIPDGKDNPRSHAVFLAREAIIDFSCEMRRSTRLSGRARRRHGRGSQWERSCHHRCGREARQQRPLSGAALR